MKYFKNYWDNSDKLRGNRGKKKSRGRLSAQFFSSIIGSGYRLADEVTEAAFFKLEQGGGGGTAGGGDHLAQLSRGFA